MLVAVGGVQARRAWHAAQLPALPDLAARAAPIAEHLRDADRAARTDPASAGAVGALCLAYHADLFYDEAVRCYARAIALDPENRHWPYYRALAQGERGDSAALATGMRRVVAMAPEVGPAWWRIAEVEFKESRYDLAEEAWRRARAAPPEPPQAPGADTAARHGSVPLSAYADYGLTRLALLRNDAAEAQRLLEGVVAMAPIFGPAFRLLAESYTLLERDGEATRALRQAGRLPPYAPYADPLVDTLARESRNSTFLMQQAAARDIGVDPAWTEHLLRRAREFDPDNPDIVLALGQLLRSAGDFAQALELFRQHRQMIPDDPQALAEIGGSLIDLGRLDEAESVLREVLRQTNDVDARQNLGFVLASRGRLAEGIREYEQALAQDPNREDVRTNLAVALIRVGRLDEAIGHLDRLLTRDPGNDSLRTNLGLALAAQGQLERAVEEFREALRINPSQPQAREALRQMGAAAP
jgi:tetratricopeptide (TPR) repeat protein